MENFYLGAEYALRPSCDASHQKYRFAIRAAIGLQQKHLQSTTNLSSACLGALLAIILLAVRESCMSIPDHKDS